MNWRNNLHPPTMFRITLSAFSVWNAVCCLSKHAWHRCHVMSATARNPVWFLLTRHWLSLLGTGLIITAVISLLFVAPLEIRGHADNPYVGIVLFLVIPLVFFAGLALVPI